MKVSWRQLATFQATAISWLNRNGESEGQPKTKFAYAIHRILSQVDPIKAKVAERESDIEIEHCATITRDGVELVARDSAGKLEYSKEGLKARSKAYQGLYDSVEWEISPYLATKIPDGLIDLELVAFSGFVISADTVEQIRKQTEEELEEKPKKIAAA